MTLNITAATLGLQNVTMGDSTQNENAHIRVALSNPSVALAVLTAIASQVVSTEGAKPSHVALASALLAGETVDPAAAQRLCNTYIPQIHNALCVEAGVTPRTRALNGQGASQTNAAFSTALVSLGLREKGKKGPTPNSPAFQAVEQAWADGERDLSALETLIDGLSRTPVRATVESTQDTYVRLGIAMLIDGEVYNDLTANGMAIARGIVVENPGISQETFDAMFATRTANITYKRGASVKAAGAAAKRRSKTQATTGQDA